MSGYWDGRQGAQRHPDGRVLLAPGETAEIDRIATAALDTVRQWTTAVDVAAEPWGVVERRRAVRLPAKATAATAATGAAGWGAAAVAEALAGPAGHLIASAATPTAAAVALITAGLVARDRVARWARTYKAASVGTVGWLAAASVSAAVLGPSWPLFAALAVPLVGGAAAVSGPWLRAHKAPRELPPPQPRLELETEPEREDLDDVGEFAARWAELVAGGRNGKVAGSDLTNGRRFDNGLEYLLTLAGGMTLQHVQSRAVEIASVLDVDPMQLVLDSPPPTADGWRSAKRATLRYVTQSPITTVVEYAGPRYRDGRIGLGPYADGQGWAEWVLFAEDSMYSGFVIGSTGSGKSGFLNGLVASARSSGLIVTIYLDPKVNSSPELAATASVVALDLDRAEEFTTAVEMFLRGRRLEAGINEDSGFTPTPQRPGYLVVIDECDMLFTLPGMGKRWGQIAKTGRALGLGVAGGTQIDGIVACGNEEMLRSNMARHNVALMRTESASSGGQLIAPSLPSSRSLPEEPGYSYLKALDARQAPLRAAYLPSAKKCPDGYNALTALQQNPDAEMCEIGRRAFAAFLGGTREERRERDKARMRAELDSFLAGGEPALPVVEAPKPQPAGGFEVLLRQVPPALGADNVIPITRGAPPGERLTALEALAAAAARDDRLNGTDRQVLAAVFLGNTKTFQICHHTRIPAPSISKSGRKLAKYDYLVNGGYGVWTLPDETEGVGA